jgi:GGDEF domain-containing protein
LKEINDVHGHDAGDDLLAVVGQRLTAALRPGGLAARIGGDEFAVLLVGPEDAACLRPIVERLLTAEAALYLLPAGTVQITANSARRQRHVPGQTQRQERLPPHLTQQPGSARVDESSRLGRRSSVVTEPRQQHPPTPRSPPAVATRRPRDARRKAASGSHSSG